MTAPAEADGLVGPDDPMPVEWVNRDSKSPILLLCEHAGQAIPTRLNGLGLPDGAIDLHIGWDIGAERLAVAIAEKLNAPLILQRYSRLVLDCNRPLSSESSIPEVSDTVVVPGNQLLEDEQRHLRAHLIFDPLNDAIEEGFAHAPRRAAFSIHTFTRQLQNSPERKWDAGILCRNDLSTAQTILRCISRADPTLAVAINKPYQIEEDGDWFIPHHAEPRGVHHSLIEVCNDQLSTDAQVETWANMLAEAFQAVLEENS